MKKSVFCFASGGDETTVHGDISMWMKIKNEICCVKGVEQEEHL